MAGGWASLGVLFVGIFVRANDAVPHNCPYRLSDIVKGWGKSRECACVQRNTLACKYLDKTSAHNDFVVLAGLVNATLHDSPWLSTSSRINVIHVRAGDGIVGPHCFTNVKDCFAPFSEQYGFDKPKFDEMRLSPTAACVIHTNTRHCTAHGFCNNNYQKQYIMDVVAYLKKRCSSVVVRANDSPDDAFVAMATANNLFLTGGSFGKLARTIHGLL